MKTRDVYITGVSFLTPLGYGKEQTLYMLRKGESGLRVQKLNDDQEPCLVGQLPEVEFDQFIHWKEPFKPTPYSQKFILGCLGAIDDAGLQPDDIVDAGCIMETELGPSESVDDYLRLLLTMKRGIISPMKFTYTVSNASLGDASRYFQLKGPSSILLTESSVSYSYDLIRQGDADIVMCCAIDMLTDEVIRYKRHRGELYTSEQDIQKRASDLTDSYGAWSSGCCAVVLESGESVKKRNVRKYAQLADCIEHPTSFSPNIPVEEDTLRVNCLKSFTGDMFYASTLFGLAANSMALYNGEIYETGKAGRATDSRSMMINSLRDGSMNTKFIIKKTI